MTKPAGSIKPSGLTTHAARDWFRCESLIFDDCSLYIKFFASGSPKRVFILHLSSKSGQEKNSSTVDPIRHRRFSDALRRPKSAAPANLSSARRESKADAALATQRPVSTLFYCFFQPLEGELPCAETGVDFRHSERFGRLVSRGRQLWRRFF